jgi:hypothetical protein
MPNPPVTMHINARKEPISKIQFIPMGDVSDLKFRRVGRGDWDAELFGEEDVEGKGVIVASPFFDFSSYALYGA